MTSVSAKIRLVVQTAFARFYLELLIASVILVVGAGYWWFLRSGFTQLQTQGRYNLLSSRTYGDYLDGYLADLQKLNLRYERLNRDHVARLATLLPPEPDLPGLFVQMAALAEQNGMVLTSVQFSEVQPAQPEPGSTDGATVESPAAADLLATSPFKTVGITAVLAGGAYEALQQFLSAVELNLRLLNVSTINFSSAEAGPYTVRMDAYYLPR